MFPYRIMYFVVSGCIVYPIYPRQVLYPYPCWKIRVLLFLDANEQRFYMHARKNIGDRGLSLFCSDADSQNS